MAQTPITSAQAKEFDIPQCLIVSNDQNTKADMYKRQWLLTYTIMKVFWTLQ